MRQALVSRKQQEKAVETLSQARQEIQHGKSFDQVAAGLAVAVKETPEFGGSGPIPGLGPSPQLTKLALSLPAGQVGGPVADSPRRRALPGHRSQELGAGQVRRRQGADPADLQQQQAQLRSWGAGGAPPPRARGGLQPAAAGSSSASPSTGSRHRRPGERGGRVASRPEHDRPSPGHGPALRPRAGAGRRAGRRLRGPHPALHLLRDRARRPRRPRRGCSSTPTCGRTASRCSASASEREKLLFEKLIAVSGIGPRLARVVLSGMAADDLLAALAGGDLGAPHHHPRHRPQDRRAHGAGAAGQDARARRRAARQGRRAADEDVVSALVNLGYKPAQAERAVAEARRDQPDAPFQGLLRASLSRLSRG